MPRIAFWELSPHSLQAIAPCCPQLQVMRLSFGGLGFDCTSRHFKAYQHHRHETPWLLGGSFLEGLKWEGNRSPGSWRTRLVLALASCSHQSRTWICTKEICIQEMIAPHLQCQGWASLQYTSSSWVDSESPIEQQAHFHFQCKLQFEQRTIALLPALLQAGMIQN